MSSDLTQDQGAKAPDLLEDIRSYFDAQPKGVMRTYWASHPDILLTRAVEALEDAASCYRVYEEATIRNVEKWEQAEQERDAARAEAARLREALAFYADQKNYMDLGAHCDVPESKVDVDNGTRARAALAAEPAQPVDATDLVQAICRALCEAEGLDPDALRQEWESGACGYRPTDPMWTRYAEPVAAAVEAHLGHAEPAQPAAGWRPMSEVPTEHVLLFRSTPNPDEGGPVFGGGHGVKESWKFGYWTHWLPLEALPPLPSEEGGNG